MLLFISVLLIHCAVALLVMIFFLFTVLSLMIFFLYMVLSLTLMILRKPGLGHLTAAHCGLVAGHWRNASSLALRVIWADV